MLREVVFECQVRAVDECDSSVSRNWRNHDGVFNPEQEKWAVSNVGVVLDRHRWVLGLVEDGASFRCVFECVVLFPDIRGRETRTVECRSTIDPSILKVTGSRFAEVESLWTEDNQRAWNIPVRQLWRLGKNSKLDDVVARPGEAVENHDHIWLDPGNDDFVAETSAFLQH